MALVMMIRAMTGLIDRMWPSRGAIRIEDSESALYLDESFDPEPPIDFILNRIVTSHLSSSEMHSLLVDWGCNNLTSSLDPRACSDYSVGGGGFGDVYRGVLADDTKIAVKSIRPLSVDDVSEGKYQKRAAKELYTWSKCKHPNVVRLLGFAEFRGRLAMVSLWFENGNLMAFLSKNPSADRCALSAGVCAGLAYLHAKDIVHGDLKGANILVSDTGAPMLTDFGNATLTDPTIAFTTTGAADSFSLRWTAPELLNGTNRFSRAADVYALGMTILEIFTGDPPFADVTERLVFTAVVFAKRMPARPEAQIPTQSVYGNVLWALLTSCWARNPSLRPSASSVRDLTKLVTPETLAHIETDPESEDES